MGPFHQSDSINPPLEVYAQIFPDNSPAQSFLVIDSTIILIILIDLLLLS